MRKLALVLAIAVLVALVLAVGVWSWRRFHPVQETLVRTFGLELTDKDIKDFLIREGHARGTAVQMPEWTWTDLDGAKRTRAELERRILDLKSEASKVFGEEDLSGADLSGVYLSKIGGDVSIVTFAGTNLSHADFSGADLSYVRFYRANLTGAILRDAKLVNAEIVDADLTNSDLNGADLTGAIYQPKVNPETWSIASSRGLSSILWVDNSKPIFALRKAFLDDGFRESAKELAVAIHRHDQNAFERAIFDWTCEWGTNWRRPLAIIGVIILLCTIIYWFGIHLSGRSALYLTATGQRVMTGKGKERAFRISARPMSRVTDSLQLDLDFGPGFSSLNRKVSFRQRLRLEWRVLRTAFLFSLMSIFNIGFREFDFGRWIRMTQPREFDIRARGWMRTVSGIEALFGVALLAFSALSYLGRWFD